VPVPAPRSWPPSPDGLDWNALFETVTGAPRNRCGKSSGPPSSGPFASVDEELARSHLNRSSRPPWAGATDKPGASGPVGRRDSEKQRDNSIRVDTARLDQVLNLSGEIGLTKNRLNALRSDILNGRSDTETLHALDLAVSQLDLLVSDLQNAVMKTRMQPIGRLFQKYPRIARDLARNLGKDVELVLSGEETEIDKTMIEDLPIRSST
jgi:two-component system chemotaxis sensor kinase CheA